jgi:hypothetical protein
VEECGPCPVFAGFILAFALQLRKKHGKNSFRVRKTSVRLRKTSVTVRYTYSQYSIPIIAVKDVIKSTQQLFSFYIVISVHC